MTPSSQRDSPKTAAPDLHGVRVLIVEDSWEVAMGLKMLLTAWGADVIGPAATAGDAMWLASESALDAALVDINLRNGEQSYGLIDRLHEQGIRIVVISGYAEVSLANDRVAAILQKPLKEELLVAALRSSDDGDGV